MNTRGLLLIVAGVCIAVLAFTLGLRLPELVPDDVRRWGTAALATIGAGLVLLGTQAVLGRRSPQ